MKDQDEGDEYFSGDHCPVCAAFNSPPAMATCSHYVGNEWDSQFDADGCLEKLKDLYSTASYLFEAMDDLGKSTLLKSLKTRSQFDKTLLLRVNYDYSFGGFLIATLHIYKGDGWKSSGMLSGSSCNFYMDDLDSLQLAEACLQKFIDEFPDP